MAPDKADDLDVSATGLWETRETLGSPANSKERSTGAELCKLAGKG